MNKEPESHPEDPDRASVHDRMRQHHNDLTRLQATPITELMEQAHDEGLQVAPNLTKKELILELLRARLARDGLAWGEGVLDILPDGFGFLRSVAYGYEAGPDDIYVSPSQVRRLNLKQGHTLAGPVRPPKKGEKYFALLHVESVDGGTVEELRRRVPFAERTPILPAERLRLGRPRGPVALNLLDHLAPMGKGQRTLVLAPPRSGRTALITALAQALVDNHPELYVILCLIDERPEDVTEIRSRTGPDDRREVVASTFDQPPARHIAVAEMVLAKAQRLAEAGGDIVLLVDSLTALVRAYNQELPHSGKILAAGLDAGALLRPKQLFGSGRNLEGSGSLSVIATALVHTDSRIDASIAEEFRGKGNSEIVLDPRLADLMIHPPVDVTRTGTRREDLLLQPDEVDGLQQLRRSFEGCTPEQALERARKAVGGDERPGGS